MWFSRCCSFPGPCAMSWRISWPACSRLPGRFHCPSFPAARAKLSPGRSPACQRKLVQLRADCTGAVAAGADPVVDRRAAHAWRMAFRAAGRRTGLPDRAAVPGLLAVCGGLEAGHAFMAAGAYCRRRVVRLDAIPVAALVALAGSLKARTSRARASA